MIDIKKLTSQDVGRAVVYRSPSSDKIEDGSISSWNAAFIFVQYGHAPTAAATDPTFLEWRNQRTGSKSI